MKKLVLLLVCAMLMTLFVAFNYLLWDKEQNTQSIKNLEYKNDDKDATINALGREIKNLEDANREYSTRIKALETNITQLQESNDALVQEQKKNRELLERKNEIIDIFKQQVDMKPLEGAIKKWAESIDKGQYETAYKLETQKFKDSGELVSLNEYSEAYKQTIKGIKVTQVEVYNEEVGNAGSGDIVFKVELEVNKEKGAADAQFVEGANQKLFFLTYDKEKGGWIISDILSVQNRS